MEQINWNNLTIQQKWDKMVEIGYDVRKNNQDGLQEWQRYKNIFNTIPFLNKRIHSVIFDLIKSCVIKGTDLKDLGDLQFLYKDVTLNNLNEVGHFFIQHFRIPMLLDFTLNELKLMQIAYNAGQFKAARENNEYPIEILTLYDGSKLALLETFYI